MRTESQLQIAVGLLLRKAGIDDVRIERIKELIHEGEALKESEIYFQAVELEHVHGANWAVLNVEANKLVMDPVTGILARFPSRAAAQQHAFTIMIKH